MVSALVFGGTGFIGGSALSHLLKRFPSFTFTVYLRSASAVPAFSKLGVQTIVGSTVDDIEKAVHDFDIVYNFAPDTIDTVQAVIKGLAAKKASTGKKAIYIQTAGTATWVDDAQGVYKEGKVINDNDEETIRTGAKPTAIHRNADLMAFDADTRGDLNGYIVSPSYVYGESKGPIQQPTLVGRMLVPLFISIGEVVHQGEGSNVAAGVHIDDLAELFALVTEHAQSSAAATTTTSAYTRYFIGSSVEFRFKDLMDHFAALLHSEGKVKHPVARTATEEEAKKVGWLGANTHVKADRSLGLGWNPKSPKLLDSVADDLRLVLKQLA